MGDGLTHQVALGAGVPEISRLFKAARATAASGVRDGTCFFKDECGL